MFGYLTVNLSALSEEEKKTYRSHYCGICKRLRELAGLKGTLSLQYDLVFLSLVLTSMYEPAETEGKVNCPRHPVKGVTGLRSEVTDYAADVGILLTWLKLRDDAEDDRSVLASAASGLLKKAYRKSGERHPELADAIRRDLDALSELEKEGSRDADRLMNLFGDVMGRIFAWRKEDFFSGWLYEFGKGLGRYLYLLDACLDLEEDKKKGRFNPLTGTPREDPDWQRQALGLELDAVSRAYEMLPLVRDKGILDNIVYSGIAAAVPGEREEDGT